MIESTTSTDQQYELLILQYKLLLQQNKALIEHYKLLIKQYHLSLGKDETASGEAVELLSEIIGADEIDLDLAGGAVLPARKARSRPVPPKNAPTSRSAPTAPPEKAAPPESAASKEKPPATPTKTRPKPVAADVEPLVARKYWLTLAGSACVLICFYLLARPYNPDAASLEQKAMRAATKEDRLTAAAELASFPGAPAIAPLERLVKESKDPDVIVRVIPVLVGRNPGGPTRELLLDTLNHADESVRAAAFQALQSLITLSAEELASFKPDDPAGTRATAARQLKETYKIKSPY
jgi:hypothetical protein